MENKLKELTDKLYLEGLSKGKLDAEKILQDATNEANTILDNAKKEANSIIENAKQQANDLKSRTESDIRKAASPTIASLKQQAENLIISKALSNSIKDTLSEKEFLASVITTICKAFDANSVEPKSLELILPESTQKELTKFIENSIASQLKGEIQVSFSKNITGGFKIGPKGEGYILSFSANDFQNLISEYLRPVTRKILFG